jgi:hypothetical protein
MRQAAPLIITGVFACLVASASAQNANCARDLTVDELRQVSSETAARANEFKDAFARMTLDKATATVSTVGATLVGSELANELSATVDGLKHMVLLRDQVEPASARETVIARLAAQMRDAGNRARKVSISYGQVSRMAYVEEVKDLAASSMEYADTLARRWSCQ